MSGIAAAALALLAAPWSPAEEAVVARAQADGCEMLLEADRRWHTLALRLRGEACATQADAARVAGLLADAPGISVNDASPYESLFLGRIVRFRGLSAALRAAAARDPAWDATAGRPVRGDVNARVARLLERDGALAPLAEALADHGHAVVGLSVEKVLVDTEPGRRLPFDAQLWLRLAPCPGAGCPVPRASEPM